jgi:hypothetical protein
VVVNDHPLVPGNEDFGSGDRFEARDGRRRLVEGSQLGPGLSGLSDVVVAGRLA